MILKCLFTLVCALSAFQGFTQLGNSQGNIRIAIISDHLDKDELQAMERSLRFSKGLQYSVVDLDELNKPKALSAFTHVWYHRTDTTAFTSVEMNAGNYLKKFVAAGGNLFLSMESVPLLNHWKIESTQIEMQRDQLIDEGFGRPAGFHAFKSHPLFEGLNGGVYTAKQKKDHSVRKHGFFGDAVPKEGKVTGIQWTYITFTEENKLLLEYRIGKGTVLAAGAYLYYNSDNYNQLHLDVFTSNIFRYTAGQLKKGDKHYWDYTPTTIKASVFSLPAIAPAKATAWKLPDPSLQLTQQVATKDFYDLVGRRILWMGSLNGGMDEIWMHPYMALRDLQLGVKTKGTDSVTWLKNVPSSVEITPGYIVRNYKLLNTLIKEIYTVSFDQPSGVAHVEIDGDDITALSVQYASNLRFMWPYTHNATGSIQYGFNPAINGHIISGQKGALNTVVNYSEKPFKQKAWAVDSLNQVKVNVDFSIKNGSSINIYITGSDKSVHDAVQLFAKNASNMNRLFEKSNQYYTNLLKNHLHFNTPDSLFDKGYKWSLARTDQFLQTTPGLGTALMAGFGTTARGWNGAQKISGRPGYAWYFGRDGQWSAMAIDAYGDFAMVKEVLNTFIAFQDVNGKIYHELTSSGAAHYDASDATPLFVVLASHYLKYSGDLEYIRKIWPQLKKAMDFCYSTDTDKDGLIENTNVGHGWIEGGPLFNTHTEFYLAGTWAAALDAASYMAKHLGNKASAQYRSDANKVKQFIDEQFWNKQQNFFHNGLMADGSYMPDATVLASVPVYFDVITDSKKEDAVSARFSNKYFSTDWGIRMIEDSSKKYRSNSYHAGMVWPLYGGWAALSEYKTGHYRAGYQHILNNLLQYRHWSPGSIEETLNGDVYKPNGVCSHQCWSETMVLQPAIEGMLGLKPDALANKLELTPYFPWNWQHSSVKNIRMKDVVADLNMKKEAGKTIYTFNANKTVNLNLNAVLPLQTTVRSLKVNGKNFQAPIEVRPQGVVLPLNIVAKAGMNTIEIETSGGIGILPVKSIPEPGDRSTGLQVTSEMIAGKKFTVIVSGLPGENYELNLFHVDPIKHVSGATLISDEGEEAVLKIQLPANANEKYIESKIEVELK